MLHGYATFIPYGVLLFVAAWALFADLLPGGDRGAAWLGSAGALVAAVLFGFSKVGDEVFGGKILFTTEARFASIAICVLAAIWMLWTATQAKGRVREAIALGALSSMGACLLSSSFDLIVMMLALELTSMPAYILIGYRRTKIAGLEGAIKYFLLSVLTTLVMTYGISFLYGISGSSNFANMHIEEAGALGLLAVLLVFVGLFAKISAAPFHYWAPDAYAGAEPWVVGFAATVPKLAGMVLAVRMTVVLSGQVPALTSVMVFVGCASLILGSFAALTQNDIRRMMAYSGVVNTGYMLIAAAVVGQVGALAIFSPVIYAVIYAVATLGVFLVIADEGPQFSDLVGLSKRKPLHAWALALFAASLIGIPPLAGFFGKLYLFLVAYAGGQISAVVIATIAAVVSAFYYLRLVKTAFFDTAEVEVEPELAVENEALQESAPNVEEVEPQRISTQIALVACMVIIVVLGPTSGVIIQWLSQPVW